MFEQAIGTALRPPIIHEVDVQSAVAVEVEKGGPGACHLRHEVLVVHWSGIVDEIESDFIGDVLEPRHLGVRLRCGRLAAADEEADE